MPNNPEDTNRIENDASIIKSTSNIAVVTKWIISGVGTARFCTVFNGDIL